MSGTHTPGPWRWEFNATSKSVHLVGGKPQFDKTVMQFARWGMGRAVPLFNSKITGNLWNIMERLCDQPDWITPFPGREHHADWCADVIHPDARLMAAAPDMLEALKRFVSGPIDKATYEAARADIAKATGVTQ